jgi:hypothetical protein
MVNKQEIEFIKINNINQAVGKNKLYCLKLPNENVFSLIVTDLNGVRVPLKDLQEVSTLVNTDGNLIITGVNNKVINIEPSLVALINSALQPEDVGTIEKVSAENIPSYTPIAIVNNQAYKFDASNINHQFAFAGFSKNGTSIGQICLIQQQGELELVGWGLTPNQQYLAGTAGAIVMDNMTLNNFTKVIGYATTTDTLQIIKDFSSVN